MGAEDLTDTPTPDELAALVEQTQTELATPPKPAPPAKRVFPDPDEFLKTAKRLAVENFNASRDPQRSKPLTNTQAYIVWFSKTLANWKAVVASPVARNLLWEVTYNGYRKTAYVDCYKKISNAQIPLGEDKAPE